MKRRHVLSSYFVGMLFLTFIFSGFKSDLHFISGNGDEPIIDMYLDSIGTGPITQKQLLSVKNLVVISNSVSYGIKSFDVALMPHGGGGASFVNCIGATLPIGAIEIFKRAMPNDMILIGNPKIF
jgi:hypothetical protein